MLLTEELHRMQRFALWKGEWWMDRQVGLEDGYNVDEVSAEMREGLNAYAFQQAQFQVDEAVRIRERWDELSEHAQKVLERVPNLSTIMVELEDEDTNAIGQEAEQSM
ncbi:hypothetical protein K435DRAFT_876133 [Dendrothele bispora CBS 962.96]|uniref:Uncharacterized protein n=1 Tax=Dendrothele bispora (strain CBS 962.96) TaxID=1314807 RepID=A0A4S8KTW9_DENBC|nr:hypothetical protein K435DRAFT_876133 [Dendrothele bispora CBS 962.96]